MMISGRGLVMGNYDDDVRLWQCYEKCEKWRTEKC